MADHIPEQAEGRNRVVIEAVSPELDCGRFPIKRVVDDKVIVEADIFADGNDLVYSQLLHRCAEDTEWTETPMEPLENDRWRGEFRVPSVGSYRYTVEGWVDRRFITRYEKELAVWVDRKKARFSAWYEVFPRSCSPAVGRHGTFKDCEAWLPYIAAMGFDVLYFPPIHPIGSAFRRGKNNSPVAEPDDVGSPWAIGSDKGGHKSIHPQLGTLDDFRRLTANAKKFGLEIALDIAFQCSPNHPYVQKHPEWFKKRTDGSIQCAENPTKIYLDIYPFDFESACWRELREELKSIILFWIDQGVRIFRVDNPHTKTFEFWEWAIASIQQHYPDALFLAEAFTRQKVMYRLAKVGFSQSYTYFAWRNTKAELTDYFTELTQTSVQEYFRPNLWPNTPDILTEFLQSGGRAGLQEFIARINGIRREHSALHFNRCLQFHETDNSQLICYSKTTDDLHDVLVVVVNLDAFHKQSGWVNLDLASLGLDLKRPFPVRDLLGGGNYEWCGPRNYVELTPGTLPAHILWVHRGDT